MPDFIVLRDAPPTITASSPQEALRIAVAGMDEYADADGMFSVALWVGVAKGQMVDAQITVSRNRTLTVDVSP